MKPSMLLERAKAGKISSTEIDTVAKKLKSDEGTEDSYTLLHILGVASATKYEMEVVRYLHCSTDPMVARMALQVLSNHWDKASRYRDEIEAFVRGVAWDEEDDVRLAAISIAGELSRTSDKKLVSLLASIFSDMQQRQIVRQAAYFALARALGLNWDELPPASRKLDLESATDPRVSDWISNQEN